MGKINKDVKSENPARIPTRMKKEKRDMMRESEIFGTIYLYIQ